MAKPLRLLASLVWATVVSADIYTGIDNNAAPFTIAYSNNASIGPDGPWWFIPQAVDFPDQYVNLLPSLCPLSLVVNNSACSSQTANCPLPLPTLWSESGAFEASGGLQTTSNNVEAGEWAAAMTALLNISGSGQYIVDRMTLHDGGDPDEPAFLDLHGMMLSDSYAAAFPGGASYTLDSGFFSLYAGSQDAIWAAANGSTVTVNRTLPDAYTAGYIPSISYGLYVGSVYPNVTGSLILGGYDSSRCLTEPIVSDTMAFQLVDVVLNVSSGGSAFVGLPSGLAQGLLRANGSQIDELDVSPHPGVPYMYLPKDTCDAIAAHLPVTYNTDFNLYFWNTDDAAYEQIISSPHYLSFQFASGTGSTSAINVPFALLNLTLESPLVSTSTAYFPCSPWVPTDAPYHLGRAFLQAAFQAQNWQTEKLYLAQAPGPEFLSANVKTIADTDTTLAPAANPPDWESTWSTTLKALPANPTSSSVASAVGSNGSLSGGAIAGIVVGAIVGLALLAALIWWGFRRRKQSTEAGQPQSHPHYASPGAGSVPPQYYGTGYHEQEAKAADAPVYEAEAPVLSPAELDASGPPGELAAEHQHAQAK